MKRKPGGVRDRNMTVTVGSHSRHSLGGGRWEKLNKCETKKNPGDL